MSTPSCEVTASAFSLQSHSQGWRGFHPGSDTRRPVSVLKSRGRESFGLSVPFVERYAHEAHRHRARGVRMHAIHVSDSSGRVYEKELKSKESCSSWQVVLRPGSPDNCVKPLPLSL